MTSCAKSLPEAISFADKSSPTKMANVAGCMAWKHLAEFKRGGIREIIAHFQEVCQSKKFLDEMSALGFDEVVFHPNDYLQMTGDNKGYYKFATSLQSEWSELTESNACLSVAFHGTDHNSIYPILLEGLDPQKRKGQVYGPGEYFSKKPTVAVGYCKGSWEILVFAVVLPPPKESNSRKVPDDYVVVVNNGHQLALGVLQFQSVASSVLGKSLSQRKKIRELSRQALIKSELTERAETKAKIIRNLIIEETDFASELYRKKSSDLSPVSKREISWYVHQKLDEAVHEFYFPRLPAPLTLEEMEAIKVQSYDDAKREEGKAMKELVDYEVSVYGKPTVYPKPRWPGKTSS